jgi:peptidoglycan hydrolase CwlO-like protein
MRLKFDQYLGILIVFSVLFANTALGFAQTNSENLTDENVEVSADEVLTDFENMENTENTGNIANPGSDSQILDDSQTSEPISNTLKQEDFLSRLKNELNLSKTDYRQVLTSISDTNERLKSVTEEKLTLQESLLNIDDNINKTTEKLFNVIKQVIENENEIALLYEQIDIKETALEYQKNLLSDYLRILYQLIKAEK